MAHLSVRDTDTSQRLSPIESRHTHSAFLYRHTASKYALAWALPRDTPSTSYANVQRAR